MNAQHNEQPVQQVQHVVGARVVADYQLMSDTEPVEWMTDTLQIAKDAGLIEEFEVYGAVAGGFGIEHVSFMVGISRPPTLTWRKAEQKRVAEAALNLLNERVVCDSDVEVRFVGPVLGMVEKSEAEMSFEALTDIQVKALVRDVFEILEYDEDGKPGSEWDSDTTQALGEAFDIRGIKFTDPNG